jgi:hypothetical protein
MTARMARAERSRWTDGLWEVDGDTTTPLVRGRSGDIGCGGSAWPPQFERLYSYHLK